MRAQSPPPWTGPPETPVPERKGPYERVEMDVPGSEMVKDVGSPRGKEGGGFAKTELGESGMGEKVVEPVGVELP